MQRKLRRVCLLGLLLGTPLTAPAKAADNVSFLWSVGNPTEMTGEVILKGVSTGIHDSSFGLAVPRLCILINGTTKNVGARVARAGEGWYVSSGWREEKEDTCFYATYKQSDQPISKMEFGIFMPQNLPSGQVDFKVQLTDNAGNVTTSETLSVLNRAQQPTFEVRGLQSGTIFSKDGEQFTVTAQVQNLFEKNQAIVTTDRTAIKSWCIGLSQSTCLPAGESCKNNFGLACTIKFDTREIQDGTYVLYISVVDWFDRTTRHSGIGFEVQKPPPIVLGVNEWPRSAKWSDRAVSHGISVDTRLEALTIIQDVRFGPSRSAQPIRAKKVRSSLFSRKDGSEYISTEYRLSDLKPQSVYWVRVKMSNAEGTAVRTLKIKSGSIPKKPTPAGGGVSNAIGSSPSGCRIGTNWGSCISLLGFEPRSIDCSGEDRFSIINSNWWIVGIVGGVAVISKSSYGCS